MTAINFLISTLFSLYLMVVLLRIWLQAARADFYNPLSQFVVKATHPIVAPLRRILPPLGNLDTATVLFAYVIAFVKVMLVGPGNSASYGIINGVMIAPGSVAILAGLGLLSAVFDLVFWVLIIRAILSWVSQGYNPVEHLMHQLTEPLLAPIRRIIPPMGGLDLSIMVFLLGIYFLRYLIADLLGIVV